MSVILITGSNQGLGFELIQALAKHDSSYKLILAARSEKNGKEAVEKLNAQGLKNVAFQQLDVTDIKSVKNAAASVQKTYGHLDVLVLNAGIAQYATGDESYDKYLDNYDTNVVGNVRILTEFKDVLYKASKPKVIAISSGLGSVKEVHDGIYHTAPYILPPEAQAYVSTKPALNSLILSYSHYYKDHVRFLMIDPGYCATNLNGYNGLDTPQNGVKASFYGVTRDDWENRSFVRRNPDGEGIVTVPW